MSTLSEARKRDFISQLILTMENRAAEFTAAGYDPTAKLEELKQKSANAEEAEVAQQKAKAAAKDSTVVAKASLKEAYTSASDAVELMAGLLGKNHNLIKEIRKMRK